MFNQGSTFAVNLVVSRLFGPQVFGAYAAVQTTVATGTAIASFGTGYAAAKYVAELRSVDRERAGRILGLCGAVAAVAGAAVTLVLLLGSPWIATRCLHAPELAAALRIAVGAVLFNVLNGFMMGILAGLERYRSLAKAGVASGLVYLALCSAGARLGGLEGALWGVLVSAFLQTILLAAILRRDARSQGIRLQLQGMLKESSVLWRFVLPSALPGFTAMPSLWLASLVLLRQPDGYAQMAFYAAASSFRTITLFVPAIFSTVNMAVLNNQVRLADQRPYWWIFRTGLVVVAVLTTVVAAAIALLGIPLLRLFGPAYGQARLPLFLLLLSGLFEALWTVIAQAFASREKLWSLFLGSTLPRDALVVVLALALVPSLQAAGLALAYALAWCAGLLLAGFFTLRLRAASVSPVRVVP